MVRRVLLPPIFNRLDLFEVLRQVVHFDQGLDVLAVNSGVLTIKLVLADIIASEARLDIEELLPNPGIIVVKPRHCTRKPNFY